MHEIVVMVAWDVHRVRGPADEARTIGERREVFAHWQRRLQVGRHADMYTDMRLSTSTELRSIYRRPKKSVLTPTTNPDPSASTSRSS